MLCYVFLPLPAKIPWLDFFNLHDGLKDLGPQNRTTQTFTCKATILCSAELCNRRRKGLTFVNIVHKFYRIFTGNIRMYLSILLCAIQLWLEWRWGCCENNISWIILLIFYYYLTTSLSMFDSGLYLDSGNMCFILYSCYLI